MKAEEIDMEIVLYSTGCPRCKVLKEKLRSAGVKYQEETDVEKMIAIGLTEVPALQIDGSLLPFGEAVKWVNKL